jgi:chemosensory pili system protein ChpA (sensor histidine kinase/response regulator)
MKRGSEADMGIVNQHLALLETQIAELIDILLENFAADGTGTDDPEAVASGLARYAQQVACIAATAEAGEWMGLHNVCMLYKQAIEQLVCHNNALSEAVRFDLETWPTLVMAYLETPVDPDAGAALVQHLLHPTWTLPLLPEDAELLKALLADQTAATLPTEGIDTAQAVAEESEAAGETGEPELTVADNLDNATPTAAEQTAGAQWGKTAQGLLDLLSAEATQMAEILVAALAVSTNGDWRQALIEYADDLERFGDGAASLGLEGLRQVCEYIRANLLSLTSQEQMLSEDHRQVIAEGPATVLHYLQGLYDPNRCTALSQYLCDARWPQPLSQADATARSATLQVTHLDVGDAEPEPRQRHAQLEDISLTLPEDVSPELLDSLLRELPQQAEAFSSAVQRLSSGDGSLADVDAAQRVAHTLKGAANTVGVVGVANLAHHLEDILLALATHGVLPTPALNHTLLKASDGLEALCETLSGVGELPPAEETLRVLQEVLDWANLIDQAGIPDATTRPKVRESLPGTANLTQPTASEAQSREMASAKSGTQVPTDLVDELLRLAGEAMILNGQLQDRLERSVQQMRDVHTQSNTLQQLVLDLEQLVAIRGVASPVRQHTVHGDFDPLEMEQFNELHTVSRRLLEVVTDIREMQHEVDSNLTILAGLLDDQRQVQEESDETVLRARMVPIKTMAPRLQRGVRQACRLTDKEAELILSGAETLMDSNILNRLIDPLMHILRNAVDHGIEPPAERERIGKPRAGSIHLEFAREGNAIVVRCRDDGAGLDYNAIRRTALARGLIQEDHLLSEAELSRLILHPGFSTRSETTQTSGRGIGMDVVYNRVQELKGALELTSEPGKGCLIELRLPVSLMSTHALLVRTGKQMLAISNLGIEQILYSGAGQRLQVGNTTMYQVGEDVFDATTLEALLNMAPAPHHESLTPRPAFVVREKSGKRRIVFVQEVVDSLTLVVKNLGRYIPPIKGMMGMTILGDGTAAPVLDLPDLLRRPAQAYTGLVAHEEAIRSEHRAPVALVVDDSLSARRALAEFVKDLGFEVRTAGDGLEATAILEHTVPTILLVDLEMPRMNGLELTAHVRSHTHTAQVPVIMITSRSTEKHRQSAAQAGVNAYLIKPFAEDELATHIQQLTALKDVA